MKKGFLFILLLFVNFGFNQINEVQYRLFKTVKKDYVLSGTKKTGLFTVINKSDIVKLNEPLKALAAYYAAMASSDLEDDGYSLVDALNLGKQGSSNHKQLIEKWFANDNVAKVLLRQDCFQPAPGSSYFRFYNNLDFKVKGDTITINYEVGTYNHGKSSILKDTDIALIKNKEIIMLRQKIWK